MLLRPPRRHLRRQCSADDEAARTPLGQLLQRHLPFATSPLPQPPGLAARACPGGLLASLPQVLAELRQAHGLAPLRILLRGPPAAGAAAGSRQCSGWCSIATTAASSHALPLPTACCQAGKSHLAARLAALYGLRVISSAAILAELPLMDGDTQKARASSTPCSSAAPVHAAALTGCHRPPLLTWRLHATTPRRLLLHSCLARRATCRTC